MITRYALFEGRVHDGQTEAFRAAVLSDLLPLWRAFPGAQAVRVAFPEDRDPGAPEYALILAVSYADRAALAQALESPVRAESRAATEAVMARFFTGRIHHHVADAHDHAAA
jgi:hypothetical protein